MALQIPKQHLPAIIKIRQLPDATADQLITALASFPPTPEAGKMSKQIASQVPGILPEDLKDIVDTLYALYYVREFSEVRASRFLRDLVQTLKSSTDTNLVVSDPAEVEKLKTRFEKLLGIENISLLSKAMRLQRDGERLFCDAKTLSDIRPVFHNDASSAPAGSVITHTLKLGYHEGGEHKEFFIVLEGGDLESLKEVVDRALSKETTLQKLLADAGLQDMSV